MSTHQDLNSSSFNKLRVYGQELAIALCSVSERVTAQIREPKIRIAVDPDTTLLNPERLPALNPLRFSGDGAYLFVSGRGMIRRYDLARRQFDVLLPLQNQVLREAQSNKPVFLVDEYAVSSDGSRLAVVNPEESKIHVIDLESGDTLHELPLPYQYDVVSVMDELFFSHDDTRLTIRRHDAGTHYVADIDGDGWEVIEADDFSLSNSGRLAILDSNSRRVTIRGSHLSNPMTTTNFEDPVVTLSLSSVGNRLLVGTSQVNDGTEVAHAWSVLDTQTLSAVAELWVKRLDGDVYWGGAWLGDRAVVLYYNETHAGSTIYDVRERKVMFAAPSVHPSNVALSPDGRWLAIIDSELGMIDVHTLDRSSEGSSTVALPRLVPQLHSGKITAMTMSDDATVVATAGDDAWISLWDRRSGRMFRRVDTGRRVIPLPASAESVALSADGRQVMASSAELFGLPTTIGIWDVASGERLQRLHDDINTFLTFLAPGDTQALMCNVERCRVQPLPLYGAEVGTILPTEFGARFAGQPMSLSTDESYLALALNKVNVDSEGNAVSSEASVGWMELDTNGRWGVISIPGDNWVGGVAALDGARVVAGLFNGDVLLVDGVRGRIVSGIPGYTTQILVRSIVPLDERRFVIGGLDSHGRHGVAIISSRDLSILQRMPGDELVDKPIDLLAVGGSGRWLAAGSSLSSDLLLWNTEGVDEVSHIRPRVIPAWRVQFDGHGGSLLVDGESVGSLWDLEDGHVYHQFRHRANDHRGQTFATLTDDGVAYLPPEESRAGLVIKSRQSVGRLGLGRVREWMVLELGEGGIEVVSVSSGESIWRREDVTNIRDVMLTQDRTGVVVTTVSHEMLSAIGEAIANRLTDEIRESIAESPGWWRELLDDFAYGLPNPDGQLFVFEAETGDTRFLLENSHWKPAIPVTNDGVVRDVLRLNHSLQIERISLTDGSVVDATHLGISSLAFAVSKPDGSMYLVADGNGQVVLWDTESGERSVFESSAIGVESVAFSSEGRVLATAETDGSVTLWDVSNGPRGVDRLASLVTFEDGDWAVVGTDGRYDASDPADLEGLAWVMPDAPTEPVPLSVFYRDYYEPRLLPRLLAGESFREIKSIADRDRKQPYVKIVAVEPTGAGRVNVTVEVSRGEAGGIGDLKLFRDGRLVGLDESATRPGGERRDRWRKTFRNIVLPTSGTELVEFSAYAFNADGVKSDTHRLARSCPEIRYCERWGQQKGLWGTYSVGDGQESVGNSLEMTGLSTLLVAHATRYVDSCRR